MNNFNKKLKSKLTKKQFSVTRNGETDSPFEGEYCNLYDHGIYLCICCEIKRF